MTSISSVISGEAQLSVAIASSRSGSSLHSTEMSAGTDVNSGAVSSKRRMICSNEELLPHSSVAIYVRSNVPTGETHPPLT